MTRIRVGDKWVQFVTDEILILTDDPGEAGVYSWAGQVRAAELIRYHLIMDKAEGRCSMCGGCGYFMPGQRDCPGCFGSGKEYERERG